MGILEIKCPYQYRECIPTDIDDPAFCILRTPDGLMLNPNHQYYIYTTRYGYSQFFVRLATVTLWYGTKRNSQHMNQTR